MNISKLVALLSLNTTIALVQSYNFVAGTLPITAATATTPIVVTSTAHGVPLQRTLHGIVSGVVGMGEANGAWILTPLDADTLSLTTLDAQGLLVNSAGTHPYVSGGTVSYAFPIPDGRILLGRRNVKTATAVVSPRIVFVPVDGRAWDFVAYGGQPAPATLPPGRGTAEIQSMTQSPQIATDFPTFEVYLSASAQLTGNANPDPDALDFDAVEALQGVLISTIFDSLGSRWRVLHESWPSQTEEAGSQTQRGQQKKLVLELQTPVYKQPISYVPGGTRLQIEVFPTGGTGSDVTTIDVG